MIKRQMYGRANLDLAPRAPLPRIKRLSEPKLRNSPDWTPIHNLGAELGIFGQAAASFGQPRASSTRPAAVRLPIMARHPRSSDRTRSDCRKARTANHAIGFVRRMVEHLRQ
jgi:hypothetical protein